MTTKADKRAVDGILIVDKPLGASSNHCLQVVKRLLRAEKAGHTGALDPLATGVLPLCFGEATKVSQLLLDADKTYVATIALGVETDSCDTDGHVVARAPVPALDVPRILEVLATFVGTQQQVAPIYSALKQDGVPQYQLARAGKPVEAKRREITVHSLALVRWESPELVVEVRCSKGTYVRSLARDIGVALGSRAHLGALRRTAAGPFVLAGSHTLDALRALGEADRAGLDALLLPVDYAVADWPALELDPATGMKVWQGQKVSVRGSPVGMVRLYTDGRFLGIGEHLPDGTFTNLRLMRYDVGH